MGDCTILAKVVYVSAAHKAGKLASVKSELSVAVPAYAQPVSKYRLGISYSLLRDYICFHAPLKSKESAKTVDLYIRPCISND